MDFDDDDSLFGSPPKPNSGTWSSNRADHVGSLCLPVMNNGSPLVNQQTICLPSVLKELQTRESANRAALAVDQAFSTSKIHPHTTPCAPSTEQDSGELAQDQSSLEALRNPKGPVRLVPTLPTGPLSPCQALLYGREGQYPSHQHSETFQQTYRSSPYLDIPQAFQAPHLGFATPPGSSIHGQEQPRASHASPEPSQLLSANQQGDSAPGNDSSPVADQDRKKCSKCLKDQPFSSYSYMNSMGQQQPRNQCTDCRKKRRVSAARSKKRKQEDMAGQHQHERQMQGQNQHQQASQELQGHLKQKKNILSPKDATTMAWDAKVEAPGPFPRASQRPSNAFPSLPGLEGSRPTASRDPSVTPVLPNSNFGRDPVPPTFEDAATTNVQTLRDMQHMRNVECLQEFDNLTRSTQMSPGSVFPPDPRFASKAPQEQSPAQPAQPQSDERYRPILSIVHTLPISLNGAELDFVVGQERQMFDQGRQTCLWMRGQDEATLQQYWRKREAAVVLGLLEVPMPSLQPKIGITRSQGSHKNMPGGNDR